MPSAIPQVLSQLSTSQGQIGLFFKQFSRTDNFGIGGHNRGQGSYTGELSKGFEQIDGTINSGFPKSFGETQGDFAIAYTVTETPWR